MEATGPRGRPHDGEGPRLEFGDQELATPLDIRDLWQWMVDTLAYMSLAETVALSAIIAAAFALLWLPRR
jgi:hypothetical protein